MEDEISERCPQEVLKGSQVVCRSGFPIRVEDLRRVSATTARSIIIMADESKSADEADAKTLRIMLSLTSLPEFMANEAHAVAEIRDIDNEELVRMVGLAKLETVCSHDMVGRSMIQCARQPGLGQVISALLGFEGCEFYTKEQPTLVGVPFGEISLRFADAIPLGISHSDAPGVCRQESIWAD